jgi:hypothetical protein
MSWLLLHGDLLEAGAEIPDGSVDAILTDPPYSRDALPLYGKLAQLAERVLRPGGACLVMTGTGILPDVIAAMCPPLVYRWTIAYLVSGGSPLIYPLRVLAFVSMPPRRSCFASETGRPRMRQTGFNATTAFLLRCRVDITGIVVHVSMPPRRSCFPIPSLLRMPRTAPFQCHHGVPASRDSHRLPLSKRKVSMPPRRSCFSGVRSISSQTSTAFQCHHGVPASEREALGESVFTLGFNATTAFLLPWPTPGAMPSPSAVSMPPRRSCFERSTVPSGPTASSFNATTAFLLPAGHLREGPRGLVSMPPRRSCFLAAHLEEDLLSESFNATTAFLLHLAIRLGMDPQLGFNATTAFLLRS